MEERKKLFLGKEDFRAINKHSNEVVYFNLKNLSYSNAFIYRYNEDGDDVTFIVDDVIFIWPETITPYTFKKDKNGKKIFMGDILRYYVPKELQEDAGCAYEDFLVQWDEEQAGFCLYTTKNPYEGGFSDSEEFEVVGNVFQNAELAKQFKKVRKTV